MLTYGPSTGAANRFPDSVEKDPEAARRLNVDSTASLATECANRGIVLIYISTDYVFPGREGEAPYAADAVPEPTNLYGQLKLDGEWEVLRAFKSAAEEGKSGKGVVLRVPVLYGHVENKNNGESAVNTLVDAIYKAQKEPVKMDHWAKRFPTNTEDVARVLVSISEIYTGLSPSKLPRGHSLPEVLQFSSEDCYTKYEICKLLAEEILALSLEKMEPDTKGNEGNIGTLRPYDCHLSTQELKDLGVDVNTQDFLGWWRRELHAFRH
jgi:dTDP-4-dehydrorhamnose reductase